MALGLRHRAGLFALHLATSTRYGYFRDALYYLACSEHLAFGYVDQPPLIAFLGWIARHTLGTSLPALLFWACARRCCAYRPHRCVRARTRFWFGGLLFLFFSRDAKIFRALAWAFVITIAVFMITHGKDYYSAPAYVMLFAAGAVATERLLTTAKLSARPKLRAILKPACFLWLILGVVPLLPLVLPVLPIEQFIRYQSYLPFEVPKTETSFVGETLPQYYADEFPWPGLVAEVARVYHSLPPEEQKRTAIFANNYGQAAAIDFFGPQYGLPKAISGHQNYFLWGPQHYAGEIVIVLGDEESDAREHFDSVTVAATLNNPYAYRYENYPILLCRGLKWNLQTEWSRVKNWR